MPMSCASTSSTVSGEELGKAYRRGINKCSEMIARLRYGNPGTTLISPPLLKLALRGDAKHEAQTGS